MKKFYVILLLAICNLTVAQNLTVQETLDYIENATGTSFSVDSKGFIYNSKYKFHASEVSVTRGTSGSVRVFCPISGTYTPFTQPNLCIECPQRNCAIVQNGTPYTKQRSTDAMYLNTSSRSTYDQNRVYNAMNYLVKKLTERHPKRGGNDPFAN